MAQRYVYGVYSSYMDAETKADELVSQGVPQGSISLVANERVADSSSDRYGYIPTEEVADDRNWFQKLFGLDDDTSNTGGDIDYSQYSDSLNDDQVLLVVDSEYEGLLSDTDSNMGTSDFADSRAQADRHYTTKDDLDTDTTSVTGTGGPIVDPVVDATVTGANLDNDNVYDVDATDPRRDPDSVLYTDGDVTSNTGDVSASSTYSDVDGDTSYRSDKERVRLHEEELDVNTRKKDVGEVEITKEVVEDTETVEVPVEREELHIKHRTPTEGNVDGDSDAFTEEEISVPLTEEEVVVDKDVRVTDEVEIEKTTHTDHETVTEQTRREELEIEDNTDRVYDDKPLDDSDRLNR